MLSNHSLAAEYIPGAHPAARFYTEYVLTGEADWPSRKTGDMNCDGRVNSADIVPFFLAVNNIDAYANAYPECTGLNADTNGDLAVDLNDISGFLECLHNRGCEH